MKDIDGKLDRIVEKLEKMDTRIDSVDITLGQQAEQLKHHIYRSDLNEENIELLRDEVKPISKAYEQFNGMLKFFGAIAVVGGIVKAGIEVFKLFS